MPRTVSTPNRVPSSSPVPIRESQPQIDSPTTTQRGIKPGHALLDTPSQETQPLPRSQRSRTKSGRALEAAETEALLKSSSGKSRATTSRPSSGTATKPAASKPAASLELARRKQSAKRGLLFDNETSEDELAASQPRKGGDSGSPAYSPPPKRPGHGARLAGGDQPNKQRVVLKPGAAREVSDILGVNLATATLDSLKDAARTLSDPNPLPVGTARRYPQVGPEENAPVPKLNHQGGYYCERLDKGKKRAAPEDNSGLAKRVRIESRGTSVDEDEAMFDATSLVHPPLPTFLQPSQDTQPRLSRPADSSGYRPTPIPQPQDKYARVTPESTRSRAESPVPSTSRTPYPKPPASPFELLADRSSRSTSPEWPPASPVPRLTTPRKVKPAASTRPSTSRHEVTRPDPNSATEEETESEPTLKPNPKKKKKSRHRSKKRAHNDPPGPPTQPFDPQRPRAQDPLRNPPPQPSDVPRGPSIDEMRARRAETYRVLERMMDVCINGNKHNEQDVDAVLERATKVTGGRFLRDQPSTSHTSASDVSTSHASTSRVPASHATSLHAASHTQGNASARGQRPAQPACPSDDEDGETDDEADYDPCLPDRSGLARYPGTRGKVASRAIPILLVTATLKGVYEGSDTTSKWARNAYQRAWKAFCPHIPYRECPRDLLQAMLLRLSNLRTEVKKRVREVIVYLFGFEPGTSRAITEANQQLAQRLGHNTFHCRKLKPGKKQYQNKHFIRAIFVAFFWYSHSFLIRDTATLEKRDREGLPFPAVAFVLTI
ncbi:hypothetical protein FRC07_009150, partial [Ceratobasidium sp. 392]